LELPREAPLARRTIEKLQPYAAIGEFLKTHCGKFSRIFRARRGYFPNKFIRLARIAAKTP
jgi:hypothetical protein